MATVGSLTEFVEEDGDWVEYVERLEHFFLANDIGELIGKQRAILLGVCGAKTFLGLVNYYGKFLPDLSTVLAPLYQLMHKDSSWKWQQTQEEAFQHVKGLLHSA